MHKGNMDDFIKNALDEDIMTWLIEGHSPLKLNKKKFNKFAFLRMTSLFSFL